MATPRGAEHRDLEAKLTAMQRQIDTLTSAVLRQRQLSVTEGDFVVSGGGGVIVEDGGVIGARRPDGSKAVQYGGLWVGGEYAGDGVWVTDGSDGNLGQSIAWLGTRSDGGSEVEFFDGQPNSNRIVASDGPTQFGLAEPQIDIPMYKEDYFSTSSTSYTVAYTGQLRIQHPRLRVGAYARANSAEVAVRVSLGGTVIGAGQTNASGTALLTWNIDMTGRPHGSTGVLRIECAKVPSSGSGSVEVLPLYVRGAGA